MPRWIHSAAVLVTVCALLGAGCAGASARDPGADAWFVSDLGIGDHRAGADARSPNGDTGASPACVSAAEVAEAYGEVPGLKSANDPWNEDERRWEVSAELDGSDGPVWVLHLYPGRGELPSPLAPGVYEIGESRMEDCSVCSFIAVQKPGGTVWFMARSGILTLKDATIGAFGGVVDVIEGVLVDATFDAVALSPTGPPCSGDETCGNTSCGGNGKCLVQTPTNTCGTSIDKIQFRTP